MNMRTVLVISIALVLAGCQLLVDSGSDDESIDQKILFEIERTNYAWGFVHRGIYVDSTGAVYRYDRGSEPWQAKRDSSFTEVELLDKYSRGRERIGQIDAETLSERVAWISAAAQGRLTTPNFACNDAGVLSFLAYRYDAQTGHYTPVVLRQSGDRFRENQAAQAEQLVTWLRTLDDRFAQDVCVP